MNDSRDTTILVVTTTVASIADARQLAQRILDERLAACVQIDAAVTSHYHWEGRLCIETEHRLVIKTAPHCAAALQSLFAAEHPYALPQFCAVPAQASQAYADWVRAAIDPPA